MHTNNLPDDGHAMCFLLPDICDGKEGLKGGGPWLGPLQKCQVICPQLACMVVLAKLVQRKVKGLFDLDRRGTFAYVVDLSLAHRDYLLYF